MGTDKTIINYLNYVGIVYLAEIILFISLWIYGLDFFIKNDSLNKKKRVVVKH